MTTPSKASPVKNNRNNNTGISPAKMIINFCSSSKQSENKCSTDMTKTNKSSSGKKANGEPIREICREMDCNVASAENQEEYYIEAKQA